MCFLCQLASGTKSKASKFNWKLLFVFVLIAAFAWAIAGNTISIGASKAYEAREAWGVAFANPILFCWGGSDNTYHVPDYYLTGEPNSGGRYIPEPQFVCMCMLSAIVHIALFVLTIGLFADLFYWARGPKKNSYNTKGW